MTRGIQATVQYLVFQNISNIFRKKGFLVEGEL